MQHGDRSLARVVEVGEGARLRLVPGMGVDDDAELLEAVASPRCGLICAERGEEVRLGSEPRELHRGHRGAAAHVLPHRGGLDDLPGGGGPGHPRERRPLEVADDRDAEAAQTCGRWFRFCTRSLHAPMTATMAGVRITAWTTTMRISSQTTC